MHGKQKLPKSSCPAHLGRLHRAGGGCAALSKRQSNLFHAGADDRAGVCRRERETFHAVYALPGIGEAEDAGFAYFRLHESEKAGKMEEDKWVIARCFMLFLVFYPIQKEKTLFFMSFAPTR